MRVTTGMMSNKYVRNLGKSAEELYYLHDRVSTGRKFFTGSEDPVGAIKAYKLRREYRLTEMYDSSIGDVESFYTSAETNLMEISNNMDKIYTTYLRGITGTMDAESREACAKELDNLQQSVLTCLNAKFEDKYVFGGTNRDEIPFTLDSNGNLCYKGISVKDMDDTTFKELSEQTINVDLGLGMKFDPTTGEVNQDTVFNMSMAGIKFMGHGKDAATSPSGDEIPNDLYSLIGKIKEKLRDPDFSVDEISPYIEKYEEQKKQVLVNATDIGAKTNYLEFLNTRNISNQDNLNEKILDVEYVDSAEAILDFSMQRYAYNAALSMGNRILENSFIDFMK